MDFEIIELSEPYVYRVVGGVVSVEARMIDGGMDD